MTDGIKIPFTVWDDETGQPKQILVTPEQAEAILAAFMEEAIGRVETEIVLGTSGFGFRHTIFTKPSPDTQPGPRSPAAPPAGPGPRS